MVSFHHTVHIDADPDTVWAFVRDSTNAPHWFAGVTAARVDGDRRFMTLGDGTVVTERIVLRDDVNRVFEYSIAEGLPAEDHLGRIEIVRDGQRTGVLYTTAGGPDELITRLDRSVQRALDALKALLEQSGQPLLG